MPDILFILTALFHTKISIFSPLFIYAPMSVRFRVDAVTSHKKRSGGKNCADLHKIFIAVWYTFLYVHKFWANSGEASSEVTEKTREL